MSVRARGSLLVAGRTASLESLRGGHKGSADEEAVSGCRFCEYPLVFQRAEGQTLTPPVWGIHFPKREVGIASSRADAELAEQGHNCGTAKHKSEELHDHI